MVGVSNFIIERGAIRYPILESGSDIFWLNFDPENYRPIIATQMCIPIPNELSKSTKKRAAEYLAGRHCARSAMHQLGHDAIPTIGENRQPIWPEGFWGSISHDNDIAISAVSCKYSIGIDIETIVEPNIVIESLDLIFTSSEKRRFNNYLGSEIFTLIFSFKESFYKAVYPYVKRFFDFNVIDVLEINWAQGKLVYKVNEFLTDGLDIGKTGEAYFFMPFENKILTLVSLDIDNVFSF